MCCIRTMNYATRSASEYTRPSSLFLRPSFSRISRALSRSFLQAGRQARSNRYYTLLLRGTRAHIALGRKREDESSCIESRAGLGAPPRPARPAIGAVRKAERAPLKCQAPMLVVNGYTSLAAAPTCSTCGPRVYVLSVAFNTGISIKWNALAAQSFGIAALS